VDDDYRGQGDRPLLRVEAGVVFRLRPLIFDCHPSGYLMPGSRKSFTFGRILRGPVAGRKQQPRLRGCRQHVAHTVHLVSLDVWLNLLQGGS